MAARTSNVLARVEPDIKEQAEAVLAQLGVPVSTVINMLYRQIILTQGAGRVFPSAPRECMRWNILSA